MPHLIIQIDTNPIVANCHQYFLGNDVKKFKARSFFLPVASLIVYTAFSSCALAESGYETERSIPKPTARALQIAEAQISKQVIQAPKARLSDTKTAPPISDCEAWKDIDRKVIRATSNGAPQNDVIGETMKDVYQRGWPEEAAKQLLVIMFAAYSDKSGNENQFVAEQFKKCQDVNARPGPKYSNVTIALYWSKEKNAEVDRDYKQAQQERLLRNQRYGACLAYKAKAMMVPIYKTKGISMDDAINYTAASAYGPGGVAYRGSQETEALLVRMVRAGYELSPNGWQDEHGKPTNNFSDYAFAVCMKGTPF